MSFIRTIKFLFSPEPAKPVQFDYDDDHNIDYDNDDDDEGSAATDDDNDDNDNNNDDDEDDDDDDNDDKDDVAAAVDDNNYDNHLHNDHTEYIHLDPCKEVNLLLSTTAIRAMRYGLHCSPILGKIYSPNVLLITAAATGPIRV